MFALQFAIRITRSRTASIMRAVAKCNARPFALKEATLPYKTRAINRTRETTKRTVVLLSRELLDTPFANGSRRPARLLLLLLLEKSTWSGFYPLPFFHSLFFPGDEKEGEWLFLFPAHRYSLSLSLSLSIYIYIYIYIYKISFFCTGRQEHDMIGSIDYL